MIEIKMSTDWAQLSTIQHGFFTRHGGVSSGCYASLNCCEAGNDSSTNVYENKRRAMMHINKNIESLITTKNIHSNIVVPVIKPWAEHLKPSADAMVTNKKDIVLGSDSADCPIILMVDEQAEVIGLAHAGWRGAKLGIIEATIEHMVSLGAKINNIIALIGPCIFQNSYEVGPEFFELFTKDNLEDKGYFIPSQRKSYHLFDLPGYVKARLININIKSVSSIGIDTYTNEDFFSCRRSRHQGESDFGGHLSFISIKT